MVLELNLQKTTNLPGSRCFLLRFAPKCKPMFMHSILVSLKTNKKTLTSDHFDSQRRFLYACRVGSVGSVHPAPLFCFTFTHRSEG